MIMIGITLLTWLLTEKDSTWGKKYDWNEGAKKDMFTLHLFFVTITFSIKRTHRSEEQYMADKRVKSLYDRAKEKAAYNISSML